MRRLFTADEVGLTTSALRWGEHRGEWRWVARRVYAEGPEEPSPLDIARGRVLACSGVARGHLAGVLHELDSVVLDEWIARRGHGFRLSLGAVVEVAQVPCTDGLQTLIDLAASLNDLTWEQAMESASRKRLTSVARIEAALPTLGAARVSGTARIRRVLALRPPGAPPTESLLETLMVQLARDVAEVGEFERQHVVRDERGSFVARVDLSRPDIGFFIELDGQQHKDQPVYDAMRETAVVAATGWLPGRFTWTEVVRLPKTTKRRLAAVAAQARAKNG
jgi:very-short-patch-repair endonuclease